MLSISEKLCLFQILILFNIFYSTAGDRKSVVKGKSVKISVDLGGRRIIKKKKSKSPSPVPAPMLVRDADSSVTSERLLAAISSPSPVPAALLVRAVFFFFKQKTAYEISECDWSSDVCSSD